MNTITITSLTPDAVLHYTTNGSDPLETDSAINNGGTVGVTAGTTLKGRAFRTNLQPSAVTMQTYSLLAAKPIFTPSRRPLTNNTPVAITSDTPSAVIRYTLDGSDPDGGSAIYASPVLLTTNQTLKARVSRAGFADSTVALFHSVPLRIENVSMGSFNTPMLTWSSMTGQTYRVQYSPDMSYWRDSGTAFPGTGGTMGFTNGIRLLNPRLGFYRVIAE